MLLVAPHLCLGQKDRCTEIKQSRDITGVLTYKSPDQKHALVLKQLKDPVFFALHNHMRDNRDHHDAVGAVIEFEDGTTLKEGGLAVSSRQEQSVLEAGGNLSTTVARSGEYLVQAFFPVNENNINAFCTKKITHLTLHDIVQHVSSKEAEKLMAYFACMKDISR